MVAKERLCGSGALPAEKVVLSEDPVSYLPLNCSVWCSIFGITSRAFQAGLDWAYAQRA